MNIPAPLFWFTRISFFTVYFWFGILKILHISPATELVISLHDSTIPWLGTGSIFTVYLGFFECILALLFLSTKLTKWAIGLFLAHMFTTFLPLLFLPSVTWNGVALSLVGQYIVKNIVFIAAALYLYYSDLRK